MKQNNIKAKIIGITGGIASGKSTVTGILKDKGYPVIDADIISREVVNVGKPAYSDIVNEFGEDILNRDLTINRKKLGDIIFKNEEFRKKLNKIVHPRVVQEIKDKIVEYSKRSNVIFLDIPLLIEEREKLNDYGLIFDEIWLVYVDEKLQLKRLMNRDNTSKEEAYQRMKAQMPLNKKKKYADVIIDNSGNIDQLKHKINSLLNELT
ncbi:dephospho-CoA kinase [Thermohalobacter berrensis]|uniref:Dephospho-CoA kinase n=1 Tax=Thermohalobacter berrensis TaxID=99594 RepID=A0A419T6V2_9FIRM|nr:dephospho-CoA kinase [Thermohalobacter berrensis]RKD33172.1 dephospho-CoA kinase [Thermohalobacter berrensis]